ncbi:MAG: FtsQ-type POTRA domain-containing protein [bacterium]
MRKKRKFRIKSKKKNFFKKIWLNIKILFFIFLVLGGGFYINQNIKTFPYFQFQKINIVGQKTLSKKEILDLVSLRQNISLFSINTSLIKKRILEHPQIKLANITKIFPGILKINIEERIPVVLLSHSSGKIIFGIDKEKIIFPIKKEYLNRPFIKGLKREKIQLGVDNKIKEIDSIINFFEINNTINSSFWGKISYIDISNWPNLDLYFRDETEPLIKLRADINKNKWMVFLKHYNFFKNQAEKIFYIDLRFGDDVIIQTQNEKKILQDQNSLIPLKDSLENKNNVINKNISNH